MSSILGSLGHLNSGKAAFFHGVINMRNKPPNETFSFLTIDHSKTSLDGAQPSPYPACSQPQSLQNVRFLFIFHSLTSLHFHSKCIIPRALIFNLNWWIMKVFPGAFLVLVHSFFFFRVVSSWKPKDWSNSTFPKPSTHPLGIKETFRNGCRVE